MATLPKLTPTPNDLALYGNMSDAELARKFVDLVEKAQTWLAYWPKMQSNVVATGISSQVNTLLKQANTWGVAVGDVMTAVKESMGIKSSTTMGFIPLIPVAATAFTWITGALATLAIASALRYALIALIGTLTAWIASNMALEALRQKKLNDLSAKAKETIAIAAAQKDIAASLAAEGYTPEEISRITGQYGADAVAKGKEGNIFSDMGNLVKWVVVGGIVYKGAEKFGVI